MGDRLRDKVAIVTGGEVSASMEEHRD